MAAEVRHCERCDHEFEVEVSTARSGGQVEGCPETAPDCGLTQPGEQVKISYTRNGAAATATVTLGRSDS